ncbi:hypothetical protein TKK_0014942 [Trichogramma kaykai]|uniref:Uncharacterized protein n=1 Tax=Trichogramma kaykai TaxID=54128 RepID=A0ABD2WBX7_9HYME
MARAQVGGLVYPNEWPRLARGRDLADRWGVPVLLEPREPHGVGMEKLQARTSLGRYLSTCANEASLHGLNHLSAARRHPCERCLFAAVIIAALAALLAVSLDSWLRYRSPDSTILLLDNNFRKFEIAKPAVTVCPVNLLLSRKFGQVFQKYKVDDTAETREFFRNLADWTYESGAERINPNFSAVAPDLWLRMLYELRADVLLESTYQEDIERDRVWTSTESGLCLVVASNIRPYIDIENWLSNKVPKNAKSVRTKKATFGVKNSGAVGYISSSSHDFRFYWHYPDTLGDYSNGKSSKLVRLLTLNSMTLSIEEVASTSRVRASSDPQRRDCKLHRDKVTVATGPGGWPIYARAICERECRYARVEQLCRCRPHTAMRRTGMPICNASQLHYCLAGQAANLMALKSRDLRACGCIQDCNGALYLDKEFDSFAFKEGSPPNAVINLGIDFPQIKYIREEIFGFTDFLGSVGGAAGLFLGASVLSVFEIIYFATLRFFFYNQEEKRRAEKKRKFLLQSNLDFARSMKINKHYKVQSSLG